MKRNKSELVRRWDCTCHNLRQTEPGFFLNAHQHVQVPKDLFPLVRWAIGLPGHSDSAYRPFQPFAFVFRAALSIFLTFVGQERIAAV